MNILTQFEDHGEEGIVEVAYDLGFSLGSPNVITWITLPSISGTGEVGDVHTLDLGELSEAIPVTFEWLDDGAPISGATELTYTPPVEMNLHSLSARVYVTGVVGLDVTTNVIAIEDTSAGDAPAKLDASYFSFTEITNPADPDVGGGGRRKLVVGAVTVPAGYTMRWSSPTVDGGIPPGTAITPSATFIRNNGLVVGTQNYNVIYLVRDTDAAVFNAFDPGDTTGNSLPVVATAADATAGQVVITIQGPTGGSGETSWPAMTSTAISQATAVPMASFTNKGNSGSNMLRTRNALIIPAYESMRGNTATDARVLAQLDLLLTPNKMPVGVSGPAAAREAHALTFMLTVKNTPRLYDALTSTKRQQMDAIMKAELVANAFIISDSNPRPGGDDMSITGFVREVRGIGPNISTAPVANIVLAASYLGPAYADDYLKTFTMAGIRAELLSLFDSTAFLYRTMNWANEGISAQTATQYQRCAASSLAPSDATIHGALRNFRYYGAALPDLTTFILFPDASHGLNKVIPSYAQAGNKGSNKFVGRALYAVNNNNGVTIGSTVYGTCINNKLSTPFLGDEEGCMIYELNGQDDGGPRSSLSYTQWTSAVIDCVAFGLALTNSIDMNGTEIADFLRRWNKAHAIKKHFEDNDYRSCSHNVNYNATTYTATGTSSGGPGGNTLWSVDSADGTYCIQAHRELWQAVVTKLGVPSS